MPPEYPILEVPHGQEPVVGENVVAHPIQKGVRVDGKLVDRYDLQSAPRSDRNNFTQHSAKSHE